MVRSLTILTVLAATTALFAESPAVNDDGLVCKVDEAAQTVELSWNIQFLVAIKSWQIARDGQAIAELDPNASSYQDPEVAAGEHSYQLSAVALDGAVRPMGECRVSVGSFGLRCEVDGRAVTLTWGPILIDVLIQKFAIHRNGVLIATVPPTQLTYTDRVPTVGDYGYRVTAVTGSNSAGALSEFLVGACRVSVECFDLLVKVDGHQVSLDWEPVATATDPGGVSTCGPFYLVVRNGQSVGRTEMTEFTDTVPAGGDYLYEVWVDWQFCRIASFVVAACRVETPGGEVPPPPVDLACRVAPCPQPEPLDPNDPAAAGGVTDTPIPLTCVLLTWTNPINYEKVLVTRNGMLIASLPGESTSFRDRVAGGGVFAYGVHGVIGNRRSAAAQCEVEVPPAEVPPPQDFSCAVLHVVLDPNDPDLGANGLPAPRPDDEAPFTAVVLKWWNPIRYRGLVILRDGVELAKLPGDAMVYRDLDPPAGEHVYGIFGVVFDGRESPTAECKVFVGEPVPPVEELTCGVLPLGCAGCPPVVGLHWKNPEVYEAILVFRNREAIARLPGDATNYLDHGPAPGVYLYQVVAAIGDRRSPAASCQVVIEGPPTRNILYFSSGLNGLPADPAVGVDPVPLPEPGHRITCLATNSDDLQGWSFGVQSDPKFVVPAKHDLEDTDTAALNGGAGPAFIAVKLLPAGVTMGVVISDEAPFDTLPPGVGHRLLNIEYAAGPSGAHGEVYPVRYSDALGDPPVQVLFVVDGFELRPVTLGGGVTVPGLRFRRADVNGDGQVDISDPTALLNWLFLSAAEPGCLEACDTNGSREVNIADSIYLFSFLFTGGPAPPFPYPDCGMARAPLGCKDPGSCR